MNTCSTCQVEWVALGPDQYEVRGIKLCSLHAAAQQMLEALEETVRTWDAYGIVTQEAYGIVTQEADRKARAAIAKAKGDT